MIKMNEKSNIENLEISNELSTYMHGIIDKIINEAGCRIPCSKNEQKGAEIVANEMKEICDEVDIEEFEIAPKAFLDWIRIDVIIVLISFGLFFISNSISINEIRILLYAISMIIIVAGVVIMWFEFFNYDEFIDRLFKKKKSQNVIGKIKPKGELKRIIIFSGHIDSAIRFNLLQYLHYGYPIVSFLGLFSFIIWSIVSIINFIFSLIGRFGVFNEFALWLFIIALPAIIALFFFIPLSEKESNTVPGAVDNLSAIAIILGLGKYIKKNPQIVPPNTEIRLIGFGCEEAGLRGAYRYVEKHYDELKKFDAIDVNLDGIQDPNSLKIMVFEPTTRTKHCKELAEKLYKASKDVNIKASIMGDEFLDKFIGLISGGTDAAGFSKVKLKGITIVGMNYFDSAKFYHQTTDIHSWIKPNALENTLKLLIKFLDNEKENN